MYYYKHLLIFWKENSIDSFHQKAAAYFDEPAIPKQGSSTII